MEYTDKDKEVDRDYDFLCKNLTNIFVHIMYTPKTLEPSLMLAYTPYIRYLENKKNIDFIRGLKEKAFFNELMEVTDEGTVTKINKEKWKLLKNQEN